MFALKALVCLSLGVYLVAGMNIVQLHDTTLSDSEEWNIDSSEEHTTESDTTYIPDCPDGQSMFHMADIQVLIEHTMYQENDIANQLNDVVDQSKLIIDNYYNDIADFIDSIKSKPDHMKHILDNIKNTRESLTPQILSLASHLREYATLKEEFNVQNETVSRLQNLFKRTKRFCELSCNYDHEPFMMNYVQGNYYCSSLENLYKIINHKIGTLLNERKTFINDKIQEDVNNYGIKITNLQNNLKDSAVKEYAPTLYEMLSLKDEYYHFGEYLPKDVENDIADIQRNHVLAGLKANGMKRKIEQLTTNCRQCKSADVPQLNSGKKTNLAFVEINKNTEDITNTLVANELDKIYEQLVLDNAMYSEKLDMLLEGSKAVEIHIDDMKSLQAEIDRSIYYEKEQLDHLKAQVPVETTKDLSKLLQKSEHLLLTLDDLSNELGRYYYEIKWE